ncbi:MAG: WD40 repeat domain-containing protein [Hyphomonadaceae bacterium]
MQVNSSIIVLAATLLCLATAAAQPLPSSVRSAGITIQEYNDEIGAIRELARRRGTEARDSLARLFAARSRQAMDRGDHLLAARYALAGWRVAPVNEPDFRAALGRALHFANEGLPVSEEVWFERRPRSPDGQRTLAWSRENRPSVVIGPFDPNAEVVAVRVEGRNPLILPGHRRNVAGAAFTLDGARIVTVALDGLVRTWDAETGRVLAAQQLQGEVGPPSDLDQPIEPEVVSRGSDIADDATVERVGAGGLFYGSEPGEGPPPPPPHLRLIGRAEISRDGQRLLATPSDGTARIWEVSTGREVLSIAAENSKPFWRASFSPDETRIVTAGRDGVARIWDAASGRELLALRGHLSDVLTASFDPLGTRVVTGSWDETARIWDATSGREIVAMRAHAYGVSNAWFNRDGSRIITAGDRILRSWPATGRELAALRDPTSVVISAALSADGAYLVTGGGAPQFVGRIWDIESAREVATLRGHTAMITQVAFSPRGGRVATASNDDTARLWNAATGAEVATLQSEGDIRVIAFSPSGDRLLVAPLEGWVRIYDSESGRELAVLEGVNGVLSAAFSHNGSLVVATNRGNFAAVFDAFTGRRLQNLQGHIDMVTSAAFDPNDERVVTGSIDNTARIWRVRDGRQLRAVRFPAYADEVFFTPDGANIVVVGFQLARIWTASSGQAVGVLGGRDALVAHAAITSDGSRVITTGDASVRIWDSSSRQEIAAIRTLDHDAARFVLSEDARRLVVTSGDRDIHVWDIERLTQPMSALVEAACGHFLPSTERVFDEDEVAGDPLIREIWLRAGEADPDVCNGS